MYKGSNSRLFKSITNKQKDFSEAMRSGFMFLRLKSYTLAQHWFRQAIFIMPEATQPYLALAQLQKLQGKYTEMVEILISCKMNTKRSQQVDKKALLMRKDMIIASKTLDFHNKCIEFQPTEPENYVSFILKATSHDCQQKIDPQKCWLYLAKAMIIGKVERSMVYLLRGKIFKIERSTPQALTMLKRALKIDKDNHAVMIELALLYFRKANYQKSIQFFQRILQQDRGNLDKLSWLSQCYFRLHLIEDWAKIVQMMIISYNALSFPKYFLSITRYYACRGQAEPMMDYAKHHLAQNAARSKEMCFSLARCWKYLGNTANKVKCMNILKLEPMNLQNKKIYTFLARQYIKIGDKKSANTIIDHYFKDLELLPLQDFTQFLPLLVETGRFKQVVSFFQRHEKVILPKNHLINSISLNYSLAVSFFELGEEAEAKKYAIINNQKCKEVSADSTLLLYYCAKIELKYCPNSKNSIYYRDFKKSVEANILNGHAWKAMFYKEELKELEILSQSQRENRIKGDHRLSFE